MKKAKILLSLTIACTMAPADTTTHYVAIAQHAFSTIETIVQYGWKGLALGAASGAGITALGMGAHAVGSRINQNQRAPVTSGDTKKDRYPIHWSAAAVYFTFINGCRGMLPGALLGLAYGMYVSMKKAL
jgi:hypothetical protein